MCTKEQGSHCQKLIEYLKADINTKNELLRNERRLLQAATLLAHDKDLEAENSTRLLEDAEARAHKAENRALDLTCKLISSDRRLLELEAENVKWKKKVTKTEAKLQSVKVGAVEEASEAKNNASAARTSAFLQQQMTTHIKVKLEAEVADHENKQTALREKVEELEDGLICVLCMVNPRNVCLFPCSHVCMCDACSRAAWTEPCPICRVPVTSQQKLYFA
jgi:hypothetical protein